MIVSASLCTSPFISTRLDTSLHVAISLYISVNFLLLSTHLYASLRISTCLYTSQQVSTISTYLCSTLHISTHPYTCLHNLRISTCLFPSQHIQICLYTSPYVAITYSSFAKPLYFEQGALVKPLHSPNRGQPSIFICRGGAGRWRGEGRGRGDGQGGGEGERARLTVLGPRANLMVRQPWFGSSPLAAQICHSRF